MRLVVEPGVIVLNSLDIVALLDAALPLQEPRKVESGELDPRAS